jgi:hypothetical protein
VLFGDSHAARSFSHPAFANLGYPGDTMDTLIYKVRRYFKQRDPGIVILQADPHMFAAYRQLENDYLDFFDSHDATSLRITKNYFLNNILQYWQVFLSKGIFESQISFEASGAQLSRTDWTKLYSTAERLSMAQQRIALHKPEENFENGDFAKKYKAVIAYLKKREASVVLVTFPVSAEYRQFAGDEPRFSAAIRFFQQLAEQFDIQYINCFACVEDDHLFADEDHLNKAGATEFAGELSGRITH